MECGKKSRLTESDAWRIAKRFQDKGEAIHAYFCRRCGNWHLGHDAKLSGEYARGREETPQRRRKEERGDRAAEEDL